jgi:hypothetical protein
MRYRKICDETKALKELAEGKKYCDYIHICERLCYQYESRKCRTYKTLDKYKEDEFLGI